MIFHLGDRVRIGDYVGYLESVQPILSSFGLRAQMELWIETIDSNGVVWTHWILASALEPA